MVCDKVITVKQRSSLTTPKPRKRQFYLLPKIHKAPETWPAPFITPAGRPIISDCGSESYQIAEFLDYYLNPLSNQHNSYLKDTYDFLQKVKSISVEEPCMLFTMDVESLYTNIDTEMGMKAIRETLNKFPDKTRPDQYILRLLELSRTKNDFEFNGRQYLQTKGTAMGKKFAPAYADIYMAAWEETILPQCSKRPPHYFRYLDDIWGTWPYSESEFQTFLDTLNNHHPSIKVKAVTNLKEIDFLDVTTYKGADFNTTGRLDTKVYFKPTDSHALLHRSSFHPTHTFQGIIKSQLIRFERISSRKPDYEKAFFTLFNALRQRGYNRTDLRNIQRRTQGRPRNPKVHTRTDNGITVIPFVATYSSFAIKTNKMAKPNLERILENTQAKRTMRIVSAYKRNPNLKDISPCQNAHNKGQQQD